MNIFVERILNKPINSNSFVVYTKENNSCIVIDPGTEDCYDLIAFLGDKKLFPEYIFLTHEHFDHIWGVNILKDIYSPKIVCSKECSEKIIDKKKNMSIFYTQIGFITYPADIQIEEIDYKMNWNGADIDFIATKGHTDASICIKFGDDLFTGDTIIKDRKTITKLPSGSKIELKKSLSILSKRFLNERIIVHSGHGDYFLFEEINYQKLL